MFRIILLVVLVSVNSEDARQPKFQVLTPDELMVEVPSYKDKQLLTFRIGVRRADSDADDLELGENDIDNNRVFIYNHRLNLKEGDVVNYILIWKDKKGYQTESGNYYFNGVYFKKPYGRRLRFRRDLDSPTTTEEFTTTKSEYNVDDTEEFNPDTPSLEPRFGGHRPHHGHWPNPRGYNPHGFNPFGPPQRPVPPGFQPPYGSHPNFGTDCNDHRHDSCHGRDTGRWQSSTVPVPTGGFYGHSMEYHCTICDSLRGSTERTKTTTERTTTTTEEYQPDIDIRFQD